jgi:twitching motility two-component system response regulator PilG
MANPSAVDFLRQGIAMANSGDKARAREYIVQALKLDSNTEIGWLWLASVSDQPVEIFQALQRTLQINPKNDRARASLNPARLRAGITLARAGQKPQALDLFKECTFHEPQNETAWMWLASTSSSRDEVLTALQKVLQINPRNEQALAAYEAQKPKPAPASAPVSTSSRSASAPAPAPAPAVRAAWQCPYCAHTSETKQTVCPGCNTMLVLTSIEALLANRKVNEAKLKTGVQRLAERAKTRPEFSLHYYLAIGYLQLQAVNESIQQFQAALKLQNHDAIKQHLNALLNRQRAVQSQPAPPTREAPRRREDPRQKTILIVDDSVTIRKLVSMTVTELGFRVIEAADGEEALERIKEDGVPDLIFLDIMMPGMDGYTLCKELRARKATANTPIIMLSGKDGMFNKMRGRMAGSTHYVTKPFQAEVLLEVLQQYCPPEAVGARR